MRIQQVRLALALAAGLIPNAAWAQHEGHQMTGSQTPSAELAQCLRVQPAIENIITAAMQRAEAARLSNSPSELRAALDHLEAALRDIRSQSAPCATAAVPGDPHAGHAMPSTPAPSSPPTPQTPAGVQPHSGHGTSDAASATKATPASKADASKSADPHAGHAAPQSGDKPIDPVNGLSVDPATAPKVTYQGQTYYFSSEQSRKEFLETPAKFAKKPKR